MSFAAPNDHDTQESRRPPIGLASQQGQRVCCSICERPLDHDMLFLDETGDVPAPLQSWVFCADCDAAVRAELDRSPVEGPLRIRIAVGIVAAERSPRAIHRTRVGLRDDNWLDFMFWVFGIAMGLHLIIIVVIGWLATRPH
jgi:hypothetical protein